MAKKKENEMANAQLVKEHATVTEERNGKLLRLTSEDGYIMKSRNGHLRKSVLTDPKRAEGWNAVAEK